MRKFEKTSFDVVLVLVAVFLELYFVLPATEKEKEKEILLEFEGNVSIDPYNILSSWNRAGDPCTDFTGITCNSDRSVEKIVRWNTSLSGWVFITSTVRVEITADSRIVWQ
ncbi:hypothetical protein Ancab_014889 [Ancistrocladus abbreviatus]